MILMFSCQNREQNKLQEPVKVIFDADMGPDYDDLGAITILHALADSGECEILVCMASDAHVTVAPTIEFNKYFNKSGIPIGIVSKEAPSASNNWNDSLLARFDPKLIANTNYPSAIDEYRRILSDQPDHQVTIISVGFLTNLSDLLASEGDQFSPLSGVELVRRKLNKLVIMAGKIPEGKEFNIRLDTEASFNVFLNWPTSVIISGHEIGNTIFTGRQLVTNYDESSPVSWTYYYNSISYGKSPSLTRQSWDQTAVLCAIRDPEQYFYINGPGRLSVSGEGSNEWIPDTNGNHYFLVHKYPYHTIEEVLDGTGSTNASQTNQLTTLCI